MIKTIIIDDEESNIEDIKSAINNVIDVEIIGTYTSWEDFNKSLLKKKNNSFDLCIIDYHLPNNTNGFICAKQIDNVYKILTSPEIIPAHDAMEIDDLVDVIRIIKDNHIGKTERFIKAIKKVRDLILSERGYILLKTTGGVPQQFEISKISYIDCNEASNLLFHEDEKSEIKLWDKYTGPQIIDRLPSELFCQIKDGKFLNINFFKNFDKTDKNNNSLFTSSNHQKVKELRYTKTYKSSLMNALNFYE